MVLHTRRLDSHSLEWGQAVLYRLEGDGEVEISVESVESVGHRSAFMGAVPLEVSGAHVFEGISPPRIRLPHSGSLTAGQAELSA